MNAVVTAERAALMETVMVKGDLSKLTPQERNQLYLGTCDSLGLNPMTRPFDYLTLNGRMVMYAKRDAADQLRKINGVSIEITGNKVENGMIVVTVRAKDKQGRTDEDMGAVPLPTGAGEVRANAMLKAITKAKRRVTLSICGLGFLDETEVEDIPNARPPLPRATEAPAGSPPATAAEPAGAGDFDAPSDDRQHEIERSLTEAAENGMAALKEEYLSLHQADQDHFRALVNKRLKPRALEVDQEKQTVAAN